MPMTTEAKRIYNAAYYQRNKARINAERIVKDIKDETQRCVTESTIAKYEEAFNKLISENESSSLSFSFTNKKHSK